jgi:hypothetical protein
MDVLLDHVSLETQWPKLRLGITSLSYPFCSVHVVSSIRGGKGGFGTLLKGQSRQMGAKITTDFGACRDLQGRRLRHVNDEIKLRKWREVQAKLKSGELKKDNDEETVLEYFTKTPTGIFNWHLMTPTWAQITNKATKKMERNLKRHFRSFQTPAEQREIERKEREQRYQQGVTEYVRQTAQATESLHLAAAIQQGMETAAAATSTTTAMSKRKRVREEEVIITDDEDGAEPNSLITLSGDLVVEETQDG